MNNRIPSNPSDNPLINDGVYEAIIDRVTAGVGGEERRPFIRIALRLVDIGLYFVTDLCLTGDSAAKSEHHLKCLHSIVGMENQGGYELLDAFAGRRLRVKIAQITRQDANGCGDYSDVVCFLAAKDKPDQSPDTPPDNGHQDRGAGRYFGLHRNAEGVQARHRRESGAADRRPIAAASRALRVCAVGALPIWDQVRA